MTILSGIPRTFKTVEFFAVLFVTIAVEVTLVLLTHFDYVQSGFVAFEVVSNTGMLISMSSTLVGFLITALALIEAFFPKEQLRNVRESDAGASIPGFFLLTIASFFILLLICLFVKFADSNNFIDSLIVLFFLFFSLSSLTISLLTFGLIIRQVHIDDPPSK